MKFLMLILIISKSANIPRASLARIKDQAEILINKK